MKALLNQFFGFLNSPRFVRMTLSAVVIGLFVFPWHIFTLALFLLAYDLVYMLCFNPATNRFLYPSIAKFLVWIFRSIKQGTVKPKKPARKERRLLT